MLIDWFTAGAQVLNFLILVWLLKRFLYKPILRAIDAREQLVSAKLADAVAKQAEAQQDRDLFQRKNAEFATQRTSLLGKATEDANAERQRLLGQAREAADALGVKRRQTMLTDAQRLNQALSRRAQDEVFAIARKALTDLATTTLEERMSDVFTRRLHAMDGGTKDSLGRALKAASEPAILRSAFELPLEQRATIQHALNETFAGTIPLRFETAPDLVSGIELTANGQRLEWSIAGYLSSLETGVGELLATQSQNGQ